MGRTEASGGGLSSAVRPLLQLAAAQAGLDGCLLTRRSGDDWVVLESCGDGLPVGTRLPWRESLCAASVEGRAPRVVPDLGRAPVLAALARRHGLEVGAWVSLPLRAPDGRLLGTLCGTAARPLAPDLLARTPALEALAAACAGLLDRDLQLTAAQAQTLLLAPGTDAGPRTGLLTDAAWARQLALHDARCTRLGATSSLLLLELRGGGPSPDVLLALLDDLRDGDALARLPSGALALLLVDADAPAAAAHAARLSERLVPTGVLHRVVPATASAGRSLRSALDDAERALARQLWTTGAAGPSPDPSTRVHELLEQVRRQLGQEAAVVSELTGGRQVLRHVVGRLGPPLVAGDSSPEAGSLCRRVLDGVLPAVMADVAQHPAAADVPEVRAGLVGSFLAAPVRLSDGRVYGALCCLSRTPQERVAPRDAVVLQVVADAVAVQVEALLEATSERRRVHDGLAGLLAGGGPQPVYQPVVATDGLHVVGVEALARFPDGRGPLPWFLEAARHGVGVDLEREACRRALAALPGLAVGGRFLSVNLSPAALQDPQVWGLFDQVAAQGLLGSLVVEVTEHEPVHDYAAMVGLLRPWRQVGLRLAIDDTGAGHASLRHVLRLEPDIVKLDRELVTAVQDDRTRADLVAALAAFADRSGRQVVAEGVETAVELACLTGLGVHLVQGYHLARPQPHVVTELDVPPLPLPRAGHAVSFVPV